MSFFEKGATRPPVKKNEMSEELERRLREEAISIRDDDHFTPAASLEEAANQLAADRDLIARLGKANLEQVAALEGHPVIQLQEEVETAEVKGFNKGVNACIDAMLIGADLAREDKNVSDRIGPIFLNFAAELRRLKKDKQSPPLDK